MCRLVELRKNLDKIPAALAQQQHYQFKFTVVGDGFLRPTLESLSRKLSLDNGVKFTGVNSKT